MLDLNGIDGYSLRHLGRHLCLAGRAAELHRLLALEHQAGDRTVNLWFAAHEQASDVLSYLNDLSLARADSAASTDRDLRCDRWSPSFGMEIHYLLVAASVGNLASNITASLLGQLVQAGLWSSGRALDHARHLIAPGDRFLALSSTRAVLPSGEQDAFNAEALDAVRFMRDDQRGKPLADLAPHLPDHLLTQAVAVAAAIEDAASRCQALTGLAPYVAIEQRHAILTQALAAAAAITRWTGPLISGSEHQAAVLADLAPHLPDHLLTEAVAAAAAIEIEEFRCQALTGLAPYVAIEQRHAILTQALAAAAAITYSRTLDPHGDPERAAMLIKLAPQLPEDLLSQAVAVAASISAESERAQALTGLAPYLPVNLLVDAYAAANALTSNGKAGALGGLAPFLPEDLRTQALASVAALSSDIGHGGILAMLLPKARPDQRHALAAQILRLVSVPDRAPEHLTPGRMVEGIDYEALDRARRRSDMQKGQAKVLAALSPYLAADLYARAVEIAATLDNNEARAEALASLAPYAPADERPAVLAQAMDAIAAASVAWYDGMPTVLTTLAPHLPADLLARAVAYAGTFSEDQQAQVLTDLGPFLPADVHTQAVAVAAAITNTQIRVQALAGLALSAPEQQRASVLRQAVAAASITSDAFQRAGTYSALASCSSPEQQSAVLARALNAVAAVADDSSRTNALVRLAPQLPADLLPQAMDIAVNIGSAGYTSRALVGLARYLPQDLLARAVAKAGEITDQVASIEALAGLAPYLDNDKRMAVFTQAASLMATVQPMFKSHAQAAVLTALVPCLGVAAFPRAIDMAKNIEDPPRRVRTLIALALHMPADQRGIPLALVVKNLADADNCADILTEIAPHLPAELLPHALAEAAAIRFSPDRVKAFVGLAPYLPVDVLTRIVATVGSLPAQGMQAALLSGLAPHLPAELLIPALTTAIVMTELTAKATALAGLVPCLTASQRLVVLPEAIAAASEASPETKAAAFTALAPYLPADQQSALLVEAVDAATRPRDMSRAQTLAKLAPLLSEDLLARALTGATAIVDEQARVAALESLAPYLDARQLTRAIEVSPGSRISLLKAAALAKAREGISRENRMGQEERIACAELIRAGMAGASHHQSLAIIDSIAPAIAYLGGWAATGTCVQSIDSIYHWWYSQDLSG
jgi:hypothetical protein